MIKSDIIFDESGKMDQTHTAESFYVMNGGYAILSGLSQTRTIPKNPYGIYVLMYVHNGYMLMNDGDKNTFLNAGEIYLFSPEKKYVHIVEKQQNNEHYYFFLGGTDIKNILKDLDLPASTPLKVGKQEKIFEIYQTIKCNFRTNKFKYVTVSTSYILDFLIKASILKNKITLKDESSISPAISYINANYMNSISLDQLAEMCFLSKYYFIRLFKKSTGYTPIDYITNERIVQAKYLLTTTDMSVTRIAETVGFNDPFHFSNVFNKKTGFRPNKYRKLFRKIR